MKLAPVPAEDRDGAPAVASVEIAAGVTSGHPRPQSWRTLVLPPCVVAGNCVRALKHDEFPPIVRLVHAKDIEVPVVSPDFEVAVIRAGPPIDVLDDLDAPPFQMNALRVPGTTVVAFDIYPFPGANRRGALLGVPAVEPTT